MNIYQTKARGYVEDHVNHWNVYITTDSVLKVSFQAMSAFRKQAETRTRSDGYLGDPML